MFFPSPLLYSFYPPSKTLISEPWIIFLCITSIICNLQNVEEEAAALTAVLSKLSFHEDQYQQCACRICRDRQKMSLWQITEVQEQIKTHFFHQCIDFVWACVHMTVHMCSQGKYTLSCFFQWFWSWLIITPFMTDALFLSLLNITSGFTSFRMVQQSCLIYSDSGLAMHNFCGSGFVWKPL